MNFEKLVPKTCCFCLQLRTGTIIFAGLYLIFCVALFCHEIYSAVVIFWRYHLKNNIVAVASLDMTPISGIVFSSFIIYGSMKENLKLVYLGVLLTGYFAMRNVYLLFCFVLDAGFRHYYIFRLTFDELIAATILQSAFLLVVWSHYKLILKRKTAQNVGTESQFHELTAE